MTQAYLRARYYDPSVGRFTQEDPARDELNWYAYCGNNPVMFVDPSGKSKAGDGDYSQEAQEGFANYTQIWEDAGLAFQHGIIDIFEKNSVQEFAETKADAIRYSEKHPWKTFGENALEFAIFDLVFGDINMGIVYAADLSGPAMDKMYNNEQNLSIIIATTAVKATQKGKTLVNTKINGKMTRVDLEFPQGGKPGNLHVQIKGTDLKQPITSLDDFAKLPMSVRKNSKIINAVKRGLKTLNKLF